MTFFTVWSKLGTSKRRAHPRTTSSVFNKDISNHFIFDNYTFVPNKEMRKLVEGQICPSISDGNDCDRKKQKTTSKP